MQKSKVTTIAQSGSGQWKDKTLTKWFVQCEDGSAGTLTTGFTEGQVPPNVGDEIEFSIEDKGFGMEINLKRPERSGGGGGFPRANPRDKALASAVGIIKSGLESQQLKFVDVVPELLKFHAICVGLIEGTGATATAPRTHEATAQGSGHLTKPNAPDAFQPNDNHIPNDLPWKD